MQVVKISQCFNQKIDEKEMLNVEIQLTDKTKEDLYLDSVAEVCKI